MPSKNRKQTLIILVFIRSEQVFFFNLYTFMITLKFDEKWAIFFVTFFYQIKIFLKEESIKRVAVILYKPCRSLSLGNISRQSFREQQILLSIFKFSQKILKYTCIFIFTKFMEDQCSSFFNFFFLRRHRKCLRENLKCASIWTIYTLCGKVKLSRSRDKPFQSAVVGISIVDPIYIYIVFKLLCLSFFGPAKLKRMKYLVTRQFDALS